MIAIWGNKEHLTCVFLFGSLTPTAPNLLKPPKPSKIPSLLSAHAGIYIYIYICRCSNNPVTSAISIRVGKQELLAASKLFGQANRKRVSQNSRRRTHSKGAQDIYLKTNAILCNSRHEPIGVRGFLRGWGRFLKILGLRERTKEEKHM